MLKVKTIYDNRAELCSALRSSKHKQTRGRVGNWCRPDAAVCFKGLAYRAFGDTPEKVGTTWDDYAVWWKEKVGFHPSQVAEAVHKNDVERLSFPELADWLEQQP